MHYGLRGFFFLKKKAPCFIGAPHYNEFAVVARAARELMA
jgi:hypothetical protein